MMTPRPFRLTSTVPRAWREQASYSAALHIPTLASLLFPGSQKFQHLCSRTFSNCIHLPRPLSVLSAFSCREAPLVRKVCLKLRRRSGGFSKSRRNLGAGPNPKVYLSQPSETTSEPFTGGGGSGGWREMRGVCEMRGRAWPGDFMSLRRNV